MVEIKNKTSGPVQLVVKSFSDRREHSKAFTTLNIPGRKTVYVDDERVIDEYFGPDKVKWSKYLERNIHWKLLSARYIPSTEMHNQEI